MQAMRIVSFLFFISLIAMPGCRSAISQKDLRLAAAGQTDYAVVKPDKPSEVDEYAVSALTNFLFLKTGAVFPVISPNETSATNKYIFVGLSAPSLKILGKEPLASLKDQEYAARSEGANIVLYGKGMHGNLYAVVDFMENTLGRRWYSGRLISEKPPHWQNGLGQPTFNVERELAVKPFSRKGGFAFKYRLPSYEWMFDFHLQSGMNMFSSKRVNPLAFSLKVMPQGCHTFFGYIPPSPKEQPETNIFGWVEKKDFFATNPEYFTLHTNGKRIVNQLCFSNHGLRKELTKNILEHIRRLKAEGQERIMLDLSAHDNPGEFCYCQECEKLKKKYQAVGGPFYDYLSELCALVKEKHPDVMLHTLAYRLSQTQKPPVMPEGVAFPDNIVIQYASVEDNGDVDWNHPINHGAYEDMLAWCKLTPHVWTWYYPFNGMLDRLVTDLRLMKKAGVEGAFVEFSGDYNGAINFTELQIYVYNKLLQDIDRDVPALVREFTDHQYGPAAAMVRDYLCEMEAAWKASSTNTSFSAGKGMSRRLTGLTPDTIRLWQESFDRMETMTADDERLHANVRRLRRGLDYRTLDEWNDFKKACPGYFADYMVVRNRLGALPPWAVAQVSDWEMKIKTADAEKPLPTPFDAMEKGMVRRFVPVRLGAGVPKNVMDPGAAFGYGAVVTLPDMPFTFGFYQNDTKTHGAKYTVNTNDFFMGAYKIYHLGEIQVTPDSIVWFSSRSWVTQLQLGERLYSPPAPDNDNRYDVHVSLKFVSPIQLTPDEIRQNNKFSLDTNDLYSVLCDQIIFVKKPVKQ
jgi:hypothetical protein